MKNISWCQEKKEKKAKERECRDYKNELEELTSLLKRIQADFENYKKKAESEKKEFIDYAAAGLVSELLPLLDSFEMAMKNVKECDIEFLNGIKMIHLQLCKILESHGLKCIECVGKGFDPYRHEALAIEESEHAENTITDEIQKGYEIKGKVIRPSRVKISKRKDGKNVKI
jgi:molecular chaperone GrpE